MAAEECRTLLSFMNCLCKPKPLQAMAEWISDRMGNPAYIVDASFKVLAIDARYQMRDLSVSWKHLEDEGYLSYDVISELIKSGELDQMETENEAKLVVSTAFYTPFANYNLRNGRHLLGHLFVVQMMRKISDDEIELLTTLGSIVEEYMASDVQYQSKRGRFYRYFMTDLLLGNIPEYQRIVRQMEYLNYHEEEYYIILVIQPSNTGETGLDRLMWQIESFRGGKPVVLNHQVVSFISVKQMDSLEDICGELNQYAERLEFYGGLSDIFQGFHSIPRHFRQAQAALESVDRTDGFAVSAFHFWALDYFMDSLKVLEEPPAMFYDTTIDRIAVYDRQNDSDFLHTLKVLLENERNINDTASQLFIHRNTLTYRIHKMEDLFHVHLEDYRSRNRLYFSILWMERTGE